MIKLYLSMRNNNFVYYTYLQKRYCYAKNLCSPDLEFGTMSSQRGIACSQMPCNLGEISRRSTWFQGS